MGRCRSYHAEEGAGEVSDKFILCFWGFWLPTAHPSQCHQQVLLSQSLGVDCPNFSCSCAVMFEIELVSFVDLKVADDFGQYSKEEKEKVSLDELLSVANAIREVGFRLFIQLLRIENAIL